MNTADILFPIPSGGRNADDMGMPPAANRWRCGHCGYIGPCYGQPMSSGLSAPWCARCQLNDKLERI